MFHVTACCSAQILKHAHDLYDEDLASMKENEMEIDGSEHEFLAKVLNYRDLPPIMY